VEVPCSSGLLIQFLLNLYSGEIATQGYWNAYSLIAADYGIVCPSYLSVSSFASLHSAPTWRYEFTHKPENVIYPLNLLNCTHADELPFIFPNFLGSNLTRDEIALSDQMISHWSNFATYANPNGNEQASWPTFSNTYPFAIVFDLNITTTSSSIDSTFCQELIPILTASP